MSSFPRPRDPSTSGLGAQLWPDITHPLPTLLLGVLSQALHPQTPTLPPSRYQGYPKGPQGWKGSVGQRGRGAAGKRNHPAVGRSRGSPHQPPASLTPKTPPRSPERAALLLTLTLLLGHPFISSPLALPSFWHSGTLQPSTDHRGCPQTQRVSPKPPCHARAPAMPWHLPRCPRAWLRPGLWLRSGISRQPQAAPSCPWCCWLGTLPVTLGRAVGGSGCPVPGWGALGALSRGEQGAVPQLVWMPRHGFCFLLCSG